MIDTVQIIRAGLHPLTLEEVELPRYKYGIVRHIPLGPRPGDELPFAPDTIPICDAPLIGSAGDGKGHTIPVSPAWWRFIKSINSAGGYSFVRSNDQMWINNRDWRPDSTNETAWAESIMNGGNFIAYTEETVTHVKLLSYKSSDVADRVLDPKEDNWLNKPYLFWKTVLINSAGELRNPPGGDSYIPLIAYTELWLHKKYIEFFTDGPAYDFHGTDVYDDNRPLMIVDRVTRKPAFYNGWHLDTLGVIPPA